MDVLLLAPLGLIVGLSLGALGGGGAILMVPILVYLAGQSPQAATTGSLVIVGLSSLAGMLMHHRAGRVKYAEAILFGLLGIGGSLAGSQLSIRVPGHVLLTLFAAMMLVVAGLMIRKVRRAAAGIVDPEPDRIIDFHPFRISVGTAVKLVLAATGVGLLTGFFGVGGGFAVVPALVLVMGFGMQTAVATSLLVIIINSITAFAGRLGSGLDLDWGVILPFALMAVIGSVIGGKLSQRIPQRKLTIAFIVMLIGVALAVGAANLPAFF